MGHTSYILSSLSIKKGLQKLTHFISKGKRQAKQQSNGGNKCSKIKQMKIIESQGKIIIESQAKMVLNKEKDIDIKFGDTLDVSSLWSREKWLWILLL